MTDGYIQFSQVLHGLNRQEKSWTRRVLELRDDSALRAEGVRVHSKIETWPSLQWAVRENGDLNIYSYKHGNPWHVASFVQAFLSKFRPTQCFQMTWAEIGDTPRGGFGGGGEFVTARSQQFFLPSDRLKRWAEAFAKRHPTQ